MSDSAGRFLPYVPAWCPLMGKDGEHGAGEQSSGGICAVYEERREDRAGSRLTGSNRNAGRRSRVSVSAGDGKNERNHKRKTTETLALPGQETLY